MNYSAVALRVLACHLMEFFDCKRDLLIHGVMASENWWQISSSRFVEQRCVAVTRLRVEWTTIGVASCSAQQMRDNVFGWPIVINDLRAYAHCPYEIDFLKKIVNNKEKNARNIDKLFPLKQGNAVAHRALTKLYVDINVPVCSHPSRIVLTVFWRFSSNNVLVCSKSKKISKCIGTYWGFCQFSFEQKYPILLHFGTLRECLCVRDFFSCSYIFSCVWACLHCFRFQYRMWCTPLPGGHVLFRIPDLPYPVSTIRSRNQLQPTVTSF